MQPVHVHAVKRTISCLFVNMSRRRYSEYSMAAAWRSSALRGRTYKSAPMNMLQDYARRG